MTSIEKALIVASKQSPSLKKLLELQDAFVYMQKKIIHDEHHKEDGTIDDQMVQAYEACRFALQHQAIYMAQRSEAHLSDLIQALESGEILNGNLAYLLMDKIPEVKEFVLHFME